MCELSWLRLGPVFDGQAFNCSKNAIIGDDDGIYGKGVTCNHEVEVAHWLTASFEQGPHTSIVPGGDGIPGKNFDSPEKFFNHDAQFGSLRKSGDAEAEFGFGDRRNGDFGDGDSEEVVSNAGKDSFDDVAYGVGVEKVANGHLEQIALLRRGVVAVFQEVLWDFNCIHEGEEIFPGPGTARQNDIAGCGIAAHVDFRALETILRGQANGLAAAVTEEFGGLRHGIDHGIYLPGDCQRLLA